MMRRLLLFGIWIGLMNGLMAQNIGPDGAPAIQVLASATEDAIRLRWGPDNPAAWQLLNTHGYRVERFTIARNEEVLDTPERLVLTETPLLPNPLPQWQGMVETNDFAAVAAQAIYGETFELTEDYQTDIVQVVQKVREQEQRFSFALFAADQDFLVAQMSGLAFVDPTAKEGERYLYRVSSLVPGEVMAITEGTVYLGLEDYAPLPQIHEVEAVFGDQAAIVSWERAAFENIYNAFVLEKSTDGGVNYQPISDLPMINAAQGEGPRGRRFYKLDSLSQNEQTVHYRVIGLSPFGERSPPSEPVAGAGYVPLRMAPNLSEWTTDEVTVALAWEYPPEEERALDGFEIERSNSQAGPFQRIAQVSPQTRRFEDPAPLSTNYYRVVAYGQQQRVGSFPVLVQLADSLPPTIPTQFAGAVDTAGIVSLTWTQSPEPDVLGYRIYRSNFKNAEFVEVTTEPVADSYWFDSVNVKTLTRQVYYQVASVDFRHNVSARSEVIQLDRPDITPPIAPVFKSATSGDEGVLLTFTPSVSQDVAHYLLFRRSAQGAGWEQLAQLPLDNPGAYEDVPPTANERYAYTIVAVDSSGLESSPAKPVLASLVVTQAASQPEQLRVGIDREAQEVTLTWQFDGQADSFKIFRREGEDALTLYRTLPGTVREFTDSNLSLNTSYEYAVQAVLSGGVKSQMALKSLVF